MWLIKKEKRVKEEKKRTTKIKKEKEEEKRNMANVEREGDSKVRGR